MWSGDTYFEHTDVTSTVPFGVCIQPLCVPREAQNAMFDVVVVVADDERCSE